MIAARARMNSSTAGFFKKSLIAERGHVRFNLEGPDEALEAEQAAGGDRGRYRAEPHVVRRFRRDVRQLGRLHYSVLLRPQLVHEPYGIRLPPAQNPSVGYVVELHQVEPGAAVGYHDV